MPITVNEMCFGLSEEHDTESFALFLQLLGKREFAELFAKRLSSKEIDEYVSYCTNLMTRHLTEQEYHDQFLGHDHSF